MADNVSQSVINATQTQLGKFVKRPPLTAKLLSRPPFKYLHDIFSAVAKEHRFMEGLFTEAESVSDNLRERDAKVAYLDKVIRIIALANGKELNVRPTSIIAGKEVENTNMLLQELALAIEKKDQNEDLVRRVLAGEGPGKKSKKAPRESSADARDDKKKNSDSRSNSKDRSNDKRRRDDKDDKRRDDKDDKRRDDKDDKRMGDKDDRRKDEKDKRRDDKDDKRRDDKDDKRRDDKKREGSSDGRRRDDGSRSKDRRDDGSKDRDKNRKQEQKDKTSSSKQQQQQQQQQSTEKQVRAKATANMKKDEAEDEEANRMQRPSSAKGNRRLREGRRPQNSEEEMQRNDKDENTGLRAPSARPAPRIKSGTSGAAVDEAGDKKVSGVIIERDQDSDDDQFVVEEAPVPLLGGAGFGGGAGGIDDEDDAEDEEGQQEQQQQQQQQHGGLVKEMLKSKKEFSESAAKEGPTVKSTNSSNDASRRQAKAATEKEIAKLKQDLQHLTRSANPLGKVIDFIQEDLESMRKELERWQSETKSITAQLQMEKGAADASLNSLRHKLIELQQEENDKLDMIATVKANIERNDDRISRMIQAMSKA